MFSSAVQPTLVSLFSSTGSAPLQLFATHTDTTLPEDSFVHLLNDTTNLPAPSPPCKLVQIYTGKGEGKGAEARVDDEEMRTKDSMTRLKDSKTLVQTVLHIQSPTLPTTYVQCPPDYVVGGHTSNARGLGLRHPWLHVQVRDLGREWAMELGVADQARRVGVVRLSTFQPHPRLDAVGSLPLLHLPLRFPQRTDEYSASTWSTIDLHLPRLLAGFSATASTIDDETVDVDSARPASHIDSASSPIIDPRTLALPAGPFSHVVYVRVYATCRLRRVWLSQSGPAQKVPWEFELYGCDPGREGARWGWVCMSEEFGVC
ncbi:hypothetical protein HDZ31DRAFT_62601 [Schizophyllum fasciatum]